MIINGFVIDPSTLVVCESTAAITTHLRIVNAEFPIKLSGHWPRPRSLCDNEIAWDTQLPSPNSARCRTCRNIAGLPPR